MINLEFPIPLGTAKQAPDIVGATAQNKLLEKAERLQAKDW